MPLSGVLGADFSSFFEACQKAEVSLSAFDSGGAKVEDRLNRVSDAFSGKRIIQDATLMAEVFDRAGGSATFTATELQRMGSVAAEATLKLRALGEDVPEKITAITTAATKAAYAEATLATEAAAAAAKIARTEAEVEAAAATAAQAIAREVATLKQLDDSFSGKTIIQDATRMAEIFNRAGGASTFTAKELERMGAVGAEAAAKLKALGQEVPAGIQRIADASKNANAATSSWLGDFGNQLTATALGMVSAQAAIGLAKQGFQDLVGFVSGSITSYASAEAAARKMTQALEAQGTASAENIADFNDLASKFQRTTVYSDDLINEMQALLTQIGNVAPSQMEKALKAATDLASGLGVDLRTATLLVAKASEENVAALKKAGVTLDETRVAGEGMEYILGKIEERFGGQAQGELDTYSGKMKKLANDWDNVKEAVGGSLLQDPLVEASLRALTQGAEGAAGGVRVLGQAWKDTLATAPDWIQSIVAAGEEAAKIKNDFAELAAQIAKLKPPPPEVFTKFGDDFEALNAEADALTKSMIEGWKGYEAAETKAHAQEVKDIAERNKLFAESQAEFDKLVAQGTAIRLQQGGTVRQQEIADLKAQEAAEIESLNHRNIATDYNVALVREKYHALTDGLGTDWKNLETISLATAEQERDDALKTYTYMTEHSDQFTRGALDRQLQKYRDLRDAATAQGRASADGQTEAEAATARQNKALDDQRKLTEAIAAANDALIRSRSASFDVTASNLGQTITQSRFGGGSHVNEAFALAEEGYSYAEILAIMGGGPKAKPIGPRIPGFQGGVENFGGGLALVGERGPELLNLPGGSDIIPAGRARGASVSITIHQYIAGVIDGPLARKLADATGAELINRMKLGRQL